MGNCFFVNFLMEREMGYRKHISYGAINLKKVDLALDELLSPNEMDFSEKL